MFTVTTSAHGGWFIMGTGGSLRKTGIVEYGRLNKKDYVFDTKQEAEQFLEEWLDGWEIRSMDFFSNKIHWKPGKYWWVSDGFHRYLYPDGCVQRDCNKSKEYNGWYETKEEAENVLYKYLSTKFQEKNMSNDNLQERLKQAIKDRDAIDSNIAEIKNEIEKAKINWKDLPRGTVVENKYGTRAVVFRDSKDQSIKLLSLGPNYAFEKVVGALKNFDDAKVCGIFKDFTVEENK